MSPSYQITTILIVRALSCLHLVVGTSPRSSPFTTVGMPACYISRSSSHDVSGLYNRCYSSLLSYPARNFDFSTYWSYCSTDHECCYHNSYPACCKVTDHECTDHECCYHNSYPACCKVTYWSYCSTGHECCYHNGYPACCKVRSGFTHWELIGLIIGCVVFVAIILGVAFYLSKRFCRKDETD